MSRADPVAPQPCPSCGELLECGGRAGSANCWCATLPPAMPAPGPGAKCLCRKCLEAEIARRRAIAMRDRDG